MRDLILDFKRGGASVPEVVHGIVRIWGTEVRPNGPSVVVTTETTLKLSDGKATLANAQTSGTGPVYQWAYIIQVEPFHGRNFRLYVAIPDGTSPINLVDLPKLNPQTGEGIYVDFTEWEALYADLPDKVDALEVSQDEQDLRIEALEALGGLEPGDVSDGTVASLLGQSTSLTRLEADKHYVANATGATAGQLLRRNLLNTGNQWISPTKGLVGLGNVDNTSDANKPVSTAQKAYVDAHAGGVGHNVKSFGAKGDGTTDDTAAIQAAVDAASTGLVRTVVFPPASYKVSSPINITASGTRLEGYGAKFVSTGSMSNVISVKGTGILNNIPTVGDFGSGTSDFSTTVNHGFAIGDTLRLVSQRVSTSMDAPYADRLGGDTGSGATNTGPYFGEFLKVAAVPTGGTFQTTTQTIFNGYRDDKTQDPTSDRTRTTVQKMGMVRDVVIRGFEIDLVAGASIVGHYAENLLIEDVRDTKRHSGGTSYAVYGSLDVSIRGCEARFTGNLAVSGTLIQRTLYKTVASQNVTLDNVLAEWAGQAIDATYLRDPWLIPNINLVVRNSRVLNCLANPLTTHPGTYGVVIDGNDFSSANGVSHSISTNGGIAIRTPKSVITNNRLRSKRRGDTSGQLGNYGISFQDGAGKDFIVSGNTVEGYDRGIIITDGAIAERRYGYVNGLISGNRIIDCFVGVVTSRSTASAEDLEWDVLITDNVIQNNIANSVGVWLDVQNGGSKGFHIHNNLFVFRNSFAGADFCEPVRIGRSVSEVVMTDNVVRGVSIYAMWSIWNGGGPAAVNPVITDQQNSVLAASAHRYPAPTGLMTLNAVPGSGYLGLPLDAHSLNNFIGNFSLVKTTGTHVTTANGYPFAGVTGYLDGKLGASGQASHEYTTMESPPRKVSRNRDTAGSWSSWS